MMRDIVGWLFTVATLPVSALGYLYFVVRAAFLSGYTYAEQYFWSDK